VLPDDFLRPIFAQVDDSRHSLPGGRCQGQSNPFAWLTWTIKNWRPDRA